jgi:hypothetical protein
VNIKWVEIKDRYEFRFCSNELVQGHAILRKLPNPNKHRPKHLT